ncbi:MAG: TetR/AcrR family transcriptional regulator [Promethearchaeota archaeon]
MSKIKKKRTRVRDPLKKEEQLQRIIALGTELFLKDGNKMSMRKLARQMDIAVSGLYRYVESKRELWFACIIKEFEKFSKDIDEIEHRHKGNDVLLLRKIGKYFFDLGTRNFPLFSFMFLPTPPSSNIKKGPYELQHSKAGFTNLSKIVARAIRSGEIKKKNPLYLSLAIWGFVLGPAIITSPMYSHFFEDFLGKGFNPTEYHDYILFLMKDILK